MNPAPKSPRRSLTRPPLKIQGGKARLASFLLDNLQFDPETQRWVEPFLGAGGVLLNMMPARALLADANPHVIALFRGLQSGQVGVAALVAQLEREAELLRAGGEHHYYAVRERFNAKPSPADFLFLNHTCFNGLMRFNSKGGFNSPFCRNPERLSTSLIADIADRLAVTSEASRSHDWAFVHADWRQTFAHVRPTDFVYADPPYAGRHTTYHSKWGEKDASELADALRSLDGPWALSDWAADAQGANPRLKRLYRGHEVRTRGHRYVVGAHGSSRGHMTEALVLSRPRLSV